jgi:hypothetical protein
MDGPEAIPLVEASVGGRGQVGMAGAPMFIPIRSSQVGHGNRVWLPDIRERCDWSRRPAIPGWPLGSGEVGAEGPSATEKTVAALLQVERHFRRMVVKRRFARQQILQNTINGLWRKGWDSNPRWACTHAGFQDRCLKPLGHPSGLDDGHLADGEAGRKGPSLSACMTDARATSEFEPPRTAAPAHPGLGINLDVVLAAGQLQAVEATLDDSAKPAISSTDRG